MAHGRRNEATHVPATECSLNRGSRLRRRCLGRHAASTCELDNDAMGRSLSSVIRQRVDPRLLPIAIATVDPIEASSKPPDLIGTTGVRGGGHPGTLDPPARTIARIHANPVPTHRGRQPRRRHSQRRARCWRRERTSPHRNTSRLQCSHDFIRQDRGAHLRR